MMEVFLTGYCRAIDASRTVWVEENEADCDFPLCDFAVSCPIAAQIREEIDESMKEKGNF